MNPLAELHERLAYSAVAGTALLEEDFRLKKMMEAFAPLAQKNPVFAKIHAGLTELFGAAPEQRAKLLLNLLGLVDAVLYTQAGVGVEGDFVELPENPELGKLQQIRYSELSALIQALTTTGSGRMEVVTSAIAEHPEYFTDYRIIYALIGDLTDPYGDMAVLVFHILQALATGEPIKAPTLLDGVYPVSPYRLPKVDKQQLTQQLKRGFDPEGKTDMLRRLMLISATCGAAENDWYLSLLDTAKKDIRALAVFSLGYQKENMPLLLELAQKERGKAKEMAYRALCQWDTPEIVAFIEKTLEKTPKLAACLSDTTLDVYGDLVAKGLEAELSKILGEPHIARKQMDDTIMPWITALLGKASEGVIALYRWVFAHKQLPEIQEMTYNKQTRNVGMLPLFYEKICETLVLSCPPPLVDFLDGQRTTWGEASFLSDLFTKSAAEVYEKWGTQTEDSVHAWMWRIGYDALGRRAEDEQSGTLFVTRVMSEPDVLSMESYHELKRPIREPLDMRWIDTFIRNDWENLFTRIDVATMPEVWKHKAGAYFYQKTLKIEKGGYYSVGSLRIRLHRLVQYGWQNFENILVSLCKSYYNIGEYQIREIFTTYQEIVGKEAAEREAERVVAFYRTTSKKDSKRADIIAQILKDYGFLPADT